MAHLTLVPKKEKRTFSVYTMTLTPDVTRALQRLSQDASHVLERTVSGSAIVRALVRQAAHQGASAVDALFREVAKEKVGIP